MKLKAWLDQKLSILEKSQVHINRIIFDIGIGFGKSAEQSIELLKRIEEFTLPVF